jgi:hypothetical protein
LTLGDITQYRENSAYIVTNAGLSAAQGLVNAEMKYVSNATNVYKIKVIADGGTDLIALYGAAVAALTFTAVNLETGVAVTVTSVAYDSTLQALTITLDATAYGALAAGNRVQINPPSASALAAASVKPYEFLSVIVVK